MTILISGATGFLGSYLLKHFVNENHTVIALKRTTSDGFRIKKYLEKVCFYDVDTTELEIVFKEQEVDIVINCVTNYGRKDSSLTSIMQTNMMLALDLLENSVKANVKAFINTDTLLEKNINTYAFSKAQFVEWMQFLSDKNTKMINIKLEHMYGRLDDENKFIYWLLKQFKENVNEINLTSGIQKRDFIYIDDIVNAYQKIIENITTFSNYEAFELGSGNSVEVKFFIEKLYNEVAKKHTVSTKLNFGEIAYRQNEKMNMQANIAKLQGLGWKAEISIDEGIKNIINGEEND